jgi:hypothetical protein
LSAEWVATKLETFETAVFRLVVERGGRSRRLAGIEQVRAIMLVQLLLGAAPVRGLLRPLGLGDHVPRRFSWLGLVFLLSPDKMQQGLKCDDYS